MRRKRRMNDESDHTWCVMELGRRKARDAQLLKEFKTLERALGLIQQKIALSKLSDEQQKILIEDIDTAITRFEKVVG